MVSTITTNLLVVEQVLDGMPPVYHEISQISLEAADNFHSLCERRRKQKKAYVGICFVPDILLH